jgi:outer membrane protein assembly factor BamB
VIRLTPTLRRTAYWAPRDWSSLSGSDTDVGSIQPALLAGGAVFQSGKNGVGYLLPAKLGGIGGETFSDRICSGAYGGTAYQAPLVYVPCTDGLYALRVQGGRFTVAWRRTGLSAGPPIVAGGAVWSIDRSSGTLHGYDATTGREVASTDLGGAISFPTPAAAGTLLVAPANDSIVAFRGV